MNKIIEEQLKKIRIADLSDFDYETNTYHIKQYTKPKYDLNKCYLIKVPGEIVKNPKTILATNWNHGIAPQHEYLKIFVSKVLGKMIYVDSIAYDPATNKDINIMFSGWLDTETLQQISQI